MSGIHLLPPLSKDYTTFCHQVVSVIVQEFIFFFPCPNMEHFAIRWSVIVQEFIYYLPCPNIMERFAIRWCLSLFRNSFITSPVQRPCNLLPSGGVCHCSGIHLLPPLSKDYATFCHQVVSVIVQEFIY